MSDADRILQYLLGEMTPDDAAALDAELQARPDAATLHARLQATCDALNRAATLEERFTISDDLRRRLESLAPAPPAPSLRRRAADAVATVVARLAADSWRAGEAMPAIRGGDGSRRLSFEAGPVTVSLRLMPDPGRLAEWTCVGHAPDAGGAIIIWRELDLQAEHEVPVDELGFFEVSIRPGMHQFEITLPDQVMLAPVFQHPPGREG